MTSYSNLILSMGYSYENRTFQGVFLVFKNWLLNFFPPEWYHLVWSCNTVFIQIAKTYIFGELEQVVHKWKQTHKTSFNLVLLFFFFVLSVDSELWNGGLMTWFWKVSKNFPFFFAGRILFLMNNIDEAF